MSVVKKIRDLAIVIGSYVGIYIAGKLLGTFITGPAFCRLIGIDE